MIRSTTGWSPSTWLDGLEGVDSSCSLLISAAVTMAAIVIGAIAAGLLGVGDRYAGTASECGAMLERLVALRDRVLDRQRVATAEPVLRGQKKPLSGAIEVERGPRTLHLLQKAKEDLLESALDLG